MVMLVSVVALEECTRVGGGCYIYIYITHQLGVSELHQPHKKLQHRATSENGDLPLKPKADTPRHPA